MEPALKENVTARTTWFRGLYILLFFIIFEIAKLLIYAVVVFQFLSTLLTGKNNQQLLRLGRSLSTFVQQVLLFVTYNSDEKPYPFGPWPAAATEMATTPLKKKTAKKTATKKKPAEEE